MSDNGNVNHFERVPDEIVSTVMSYSTGFNELQEWSLSDWRFRECRLLSTAHETFDSEVTDLLQTAVNSEEKMMRFVRGLATYKPRLTELSFEGKFEFVDDGVLEVACSLFGVLKKLIICGGKITDWSPLHSLVLLEELKIMDSKLGGIDDDGLECLIPLSNLRHLTLCGFGITDASITHLSKLTSLLVLNTEVTQISKEGFEQLGNSLPNACFVDISACDVESDQEEDDEFEDEFEDEYDGEDKSHWDASDHVDYLLNLYRRRAHEEYGEEDY